MIHSEIMTYMDKTQTFKKQKNHVKEKSRSSFMPNGTYWMYGTHAVVEACHNPKRKVHEIIYTKDADGITLPSSAQCVDKQELRSILGEDCVHQGIACRVSPLETVSIHNMAAHVKTWEDHRTSQQPPRIMVLDHVTDPHNVGAILRSCAVFGVTALMVTDRHAPSESGVLAKTACGALEHVPMIRVTNLAQGLEHLKKSGFWVIGLAEGGGQTLAHVDWSVPTALVMGAEGTGLRALTIKCCDHLVVIPSTGTFSTLNVSNAAAVTLYAAFMGSFL